MNKILIVAWQSLLKNLKSWSFYIMVFMPIVFPLIIGLISYFISSSTDSGTGAENVDTIALVTSPGDLLGDETWEGQEEASLKLTQDYPDLDQAKQAYQDGEIDGILEISGQRDQVEATLYHEGNLSYALPYLEGQLSQSQAQARAAELAISQEDLTALTQGVDIGDNQYFLAEDDTAPALFSASELQMVLAVLVNLVTFFFILFYSGMICEEIANEKGSRVMEVILSSITASQHFFGKLLGVAFTLLVHLAIYFLLALVGFFFLRQNEVLDIILQFIGQSLASVQGVLALSVLFVVLGVLSYTVISAFLGSLVTKTEDANKVMVPLVFLALFGFYLGFFIQSGVLEDGLLVNVLSHLPFLMPHIMPFRMAMGTVGGLELALSIGGNMVFLILLTWLSLVFYRSNVLVYSSENFIQQIKRSWSLMRSNRKAKNS
ncbi:ABC-2 family transporter protein [Alloiococcus otitis]|uniref:ABC-2 type transporter transmembrane domain-containing protein n=1 Tax=Alloiococcus otitis ATCC 51267 TaxID=883081 RepID=K9E9H8_9LACT|nr:ABC transporter permease [Alloiococcus otitis]EKU93338.1 hypothetical protein HMPREF9698_01086 [Alloiococcus otitis ATCC 51267]SUU81555.1 ABC-2 family transporter protein [Alloiococcus otitis]